MLNTLGIDKPFDAVKMCGPHFSKKEITVNKLLLATAVASMMASPFASALDAGQTYIEVKATSSNYDTEVDSNNDRATGVSFSGGYKIPDSKWAVEAGYADLGESSGDFLGSEFTLDSSTVFVAGKYLAEIQDNLTVFGLVGLNLITAETEIPDLLVSDEETETKLMYGAGAQYDVTNTLAATASYVAYAADITSLQVGLAYRF